MDGTLIDSGNIISNTINYVRVNIGLNPLEKNDILESLNNPDINSAKYFYEVDDFTEQHSILFNEYYNKNCLSDIVLYDGIENMLDILSKKGYILSVATNGSFDYANRMLNHLKIDNYFDMIVGANCVKNPKPHPDMLLKIMNNLKIDKDNTIMVGDSLKDIQSANNANINSFLVNWGFSNHNKEDALLTVDELVKNILLKTY